MRLALSRAMRHLALLAVLISTPTAARAEDGAGADQGTARALTIGATLASAAILGSGLAVENDELALAGGAGLLFLPSLGHWYAGDTAAVGLGLRVGGVLAAGLGTYLVFRSIDLGDEGHADQDDELLGVLGLGLALGGSAAMVGGIAYDWLTVDAAVRENHVRLAPVASSRGLGLALAGSF
jgi:hypothetical protein